MQNLLLQSIFYFFSGLVVLSALLVITQNNPVRCVLFLVVSFIASAVLWMLVQAEFLALILVLVYVGAVMTLFLFVVMMLNIDIESMKAHFIRYLPFGLILGALLIGLLLVAMPENQFQTGVEVLTATTHVADDIYIEGSAAPQSLPESNTAGLGMVLYSDYVLAFEMAAMILLVAIIAAITLVHRGPIRSKRQDVVRQIMTRREDRVTLVKMKPEQSSGQT